MVIFDILASHHRMLIWHMNSVEGLLLDKTEKAKPDSSSGEATQSNNTQETSNAECTDQDNSKDKGGNETGSPADEAENEADAETGNKLQIENTPLDRRWVPTKFPWALQMLSACIAYGRPAPTSHETLLYIVHCAMSL